MLKSFLSWVGGKLNLRDIIYERFPLKYDSYIEVFGGAAWVLLGMKKQSKLEVYNDFNSNLVNLFRCVKERILAFLQELGFLPLTSRTEFNLLKRYLQKKPFHESYAKEEIEIAQKMLPEPEAEEIRALITERCEDIDIHRAVTFFKVIRYSYASSGTSFGCKPIDIRKIFSLIWAANARLKNTLLENQDFSLLIRHYDSDDAFFYLDPPYYAAEYFYKGFGRIDHIRLRDVLKNIQGKWLLSYNDSRHIRFLYRHYYIEEVERPHNMSLRYGGGKIYKELLISNYDTTERSKSRPDQTSLFQAERGALISTKKNGVASLFGILNRSNQSI